MTVTPTALTTRPAPTATRAPRRRDRPNLLGGLAGWVWLAVIILPIYYIVVTSFRRPEALYTQNPLSIPADPTSAAYGRVLANDFLRYFGNSVYVTSVSVVLMLAVSFLTAYVVVRSRRPLVRQIFQVFLLGIAIPIQATIIPVYYLIRQLGLYDNLWAVVLPSVAFGIPLTVLILTSFMRDIPHELFESMTVDGAGEWRTLRSLALPMSRPALATVAIYNALHVWNSFLFPLVLTQSSRNRVLPMALWSFQGEFTIDVPAVLAAVVLSVLPILAAYLVGRRQLVAGLSAGFGK